MMTSRAEYRLFLRQDNADARLTPHGYRLGLISEARYMLFKSKQAAIEAEIKRLRQTVLPPSNALNTLLISRSSTPVSSGVSMADLLKRPEIKYKDLHTVDTNRPKLNEAITFTVEVDIKYEGYLKLEKQKIDKFKALEVRTLSLNTPYEEIKGLRIEAQQKLSKFRPISLGQASRISGVSPADVAVLLVY